MKNWLKHYFIPNNGNNYQPHILQRAAVVMMSFLLVMTFAFANLQGILWQGSQWLVGAVLPAVVVELTNESRSEASLGGLRRSKLLDEAAQLKAEHMAKVGYFAHYAPDGTSPWYWFEKVSYNYINAGENLAVHFTDSDEVVKAWLESPTHRANIMNGNYTEIGVGTAKGKFEGFDTVFVVQLFGTPAAGAPAPVAARSDTGVVLAATTPVTDVEANAETVTEPTPEAVESTERAEEIAPVAEPIPETPAVTPVTNENGDTVALMSDTATTARAAEYSNDTPVAEVDMPVSTVARMATQPQRLLNMVYVATAVFVLVSLMLSIFIEIRKQHPVQIAYGTALLAVMALLSYLHMVVAGGALIA